MHQYLKPPPSEWQPPPRVPGTGTCRTCTSAAFEAGRDAAESPMPLAVLVRRFVEALPASADEYHRETLASNFRRGVLAVRVLVGGEAHP